MSRYPPPERESGCLLDSTTTSIPDANTAIVALVARSHRTVRQNLDRNAKQRPDRLGRCLFQHANLFAANEVSWCRNGATTHSVTVQW
jgi:hypothetical protein